MPTKIELSMIKQVGFPDRVGSIRMTYTNENGQKVLTDHIGNPGGKNKCTINIPNGTRIGTVQWHNDNTIVGLRVLDKEGRKI